MKKQFTSALGFCAALLLTLTACKKDEVQTTLQPGTAPAVSASANNIVLLQTNMNDKAVTYTWTPVTFGYQAVVSYRLQFDKKGGDFSSPYIVEVGAATTKTLTVSDLNGVYQAKNLVSASTDPVPTALDVRVVASVGQAAPPVVSAVTTTTATPFAFCAQPDAKNAWAIIGPAGISWDADVTMTYDCASKTYSYTGPLKADSFKFRYGGAWAANLGGGPVTGGTLTQDGSDMKLTTAGTYTIVLTPGAIGADGKAAGGSFTIK